jgi:AraC family transcriptional activator of tynA and feaB
MTATAATEIDVLDFEAIESGARWEAAVRDVLGPMTVRLLQRRSNAGRFRSREVGDLQFADWDCPPLEGVVSLGEARDAQRDVVVVLAGYGGEERLSFAGTDAALVNGTVVVATGGYDGDGFSVPERVRKRTLTLPRVVLLAAGCDANIPGCLVLEQDRPLVGVLLMVLDQVWSRLPAMHPSEIEATRRALVALTAGIIRAETGSFTDRSGLPALRAQIDNWITRNLRSGPIHIEDLAAAHNVSTRTIHRAFSLTGDTMTAVVRARRMAAVREELVNSNMTIATIAHRWCYYDPSHLRREFHRSFGVSPSEYRESHGC